MGSPRIQRRPVLNRPRCEPARSRYSPNAPPRRRRIRPRPRSSADRRNSRRRARPSGFPLALSARIRHDLRRSAGVKVLGGAHGSDLEQKEPLRPRRARRNGGSARRRRVFPQSLRGEKVVRQLFHESFRREPSDRPRPSASIGEPHRDARRPAGIRRPRGCRQSLLRVPLRRHRYGFGPLPHSRPRQNRRSALKIHGRTSASANHTRARRPQSKIRGSSGRCQPERKHNLRSTAPPTSSPQVHLRSRQARRSSGTSPSSPLDSHFHPRPAALKSGEKSSLRRQPDRCRFGG